MENVILVLIGLGLVGTIGLISYLVYKLGQKKNTVVETIAVTPSAYIDIDSYVSKFKVKYDNKVAVKQDYCKSIFEIFHSNISKIFEVTYVGRTVDKTDDEYIDVYQLSHALNGKVYEAYLELTKTKVNINHIKGNFNKDTLNIEHDRVDVIHEYKLLYPDPVVGANIKEVMIEDCIDISAYEHIVTDKIAQPILYELKRDNNGRFILGPTYIKQNWSLSREEIETNYMNINMKMLSKFWDLHPQKAPEMIMEILKTGMSVAMLGNTGVGKTRLIEHIIQLSSGTDLIFVNTNAVTLRHLMSASVDLSSIFNEDKIYCLLVSEADDLLQEDLSIIKEFTDSTTSKTYHLSMLFSYNEDKFDDSTDALRDGRVFTFRIPLLSKEQAIKAAERLRGATSDTHTFEYDDCIAYIHLKDSVKLSTIYSFLVTNKTKEILLRTEELINSLGLEAPIPTPALPVMGTPVGKQFQFKPRERGK
jgi:hypothetical protein